MLHLYRALLRLYPMRFVGEFGEEMLSIACELYRGCHDKGFVARMRFGLREVSGLLAGALRERIYKRDRKPSGGTMRSYRFPRWTIIMMILIFCAVNTAIEMGRQASVQLSGGHAISRWWTLPGVFLSVFAVLGVVGFIGHCVLRMLRGARSGSGA